MRRASPLGRLVAPQLLDRFASEVWCRRVAHFRAGDDGGRMAGIYGLEDWSARTGIINVDAAARGANEQHHPEAIAIDEIEDRYGSGMTICANVSGHPRLAAYLRAIEREVGAFRGQAFAKVYDSPDGTGFPVHFDIDHVFVVQLEGTKVWQCSSGPVVQGPLAAGKVDASGAVVYTHPEEGRSPVDSKGRTVAAPAIDELTRYELEPGDCLYVPPGAWHRATAKGRSVALSVSPPRATPARLVLAVLEELLLADPAWRSDLALFSDGGARAAKQQLDQRLSSLRRLVGGVETSLLLRRWFSALSASEAGAGVHEAAVKRSDRLVRTGPLRYLQVGEDLLLYGGGEEWSLGLESESFLDALGKAEAFRADEVLKWDPTLGWSDAQAFLGQLLEIGVLRRED